MAQFAVPIAIALVATAAVFILTKPKGTHTKGPRLGDLKVTDSAYGKPIPILRGRGRAGGNIIQASALREIPHTVKVDGGGKGSSSSNKQTSYTAEVDFAMMIGEGEIDRILRIWFDGKIVYDITNTNGLVRKPGLIFRFYKGTEDQLPDPLIESLVGENLAPAYRGISYLVFEKLQLADYGNRPPQVTVEYSETSTSLQLFKTLEGTDSSFGYNVATLAVNEITRKGYTIRPTTSSWLATIGDTLLVEFDIDTMLVTRTKLYSEAISIPLSLDPFPEDTTVFGQLGMGVYDNRLYLFMEYPFDNEVMVPIDMTTLSTSSSYLFRDTLPPKNYLDIKAATMTQVRVFTALGEEWIYNVYISANGDPVDGDTLTVTRQFPSYTTDTIIPNITGTVFTPTIAQLFGAPTYYANSLSIAGQQQSNTADVWLVIGGNHANYFSEGDPVYTRDLAIAKLICSPAIVLYAEFERIGIDGFSWHVALAEVDPLAVAWGMMKTVAYVPADDSLIIIIDTYRAFIADEIDPSSRTGFAIKWRNDEIIWAIEVPIMRRGVEPLTGPGFVADTWSQLVDLQQSFSYTTDADNVVELNTITGEYNIIPFTAAGDFRTLNTNQYYSPIDDSVIARITPTSDEWVKIYLNRAAAEGIAVADIVQQLSLRAGLSIGEFDVTAITGPEFEVGGFQATQPSSARANIEPLEVAFSFYSVESDYVIKFIPKDGAIAPVDIAERYLVQNNNIDLLEEHRVQEFDLPAYVGITFMDQDRDYNTGTVPYRRPSNPSATMLSDNRVEIELPLVWDYSSVKRVAERSLYSAWQERVNYKGRMSWDYIWLDPGDEMNVIFDNGDILPQRIEKQSIGADLTMEFESVSSDVATYSSTAIGYGGITPIRKTFPQALTSRPFIMDTPLLSDTHNPSAGLSMEYYGMAGYGADGWRGAILFKSSDNLVWDEVADTTIELPYGTLATSLPDNLDPFATDYDLELEVYMVTQENELQSITYEQFINGGNAAAIVKGNGEIEVIQFQVAVNNGEGWFTLSAIARGRRGTNVFCNGHTSSELFILLEPSSGILKPIATSEIGSPFYYKAVTLGTLLADAPIISHTTLGNDLKPYMPTHFTATIVATDIQFEWVRNTRIGGALMDGTGDVPLSEDAELYDLEIFDAPGGTVVRTFSGITSPDQLYLDADIITDFGSMPTNITFKIYQISALVGRGLNRELTVEVV